MIYLITGGSGCGKSTWAEKLVRARPAGDRVYIATMQVYDRESEIRVQRHRAQRAGLGFRTVECEKDLSAVQVETGSVVLLEDLVNLAANEMFDEAGAMTDPETAVLSGVDALRAQCDLLVVITNDVGSDGCAYPPETRAYVNVLGRINAALAARADTVCELVAGSPILLKGALPV